MTFSASRITTWMSCNRKAAWLYICGYPDPGNQDTEFGGAVHQALYEFGRNPALLPDLSDPVQAVAAEALPYVHAALTCETAFEGEIAVVGQHKWTGMRDLNPYPGAVWDYKTTGDFKNCKTPEQLQSDPQAILYAKAELDLHPALDHVDLMWLYLKKRKAYGARPVEARIERDDAQRGFAALESFATEMQEAAFAAPLDPVARHKYVLDVVQPNFGHCTAYRGCPYRDRCVDSPLFTNPDPKGYLEMGLLQRLQEMASGLPVTPAASAAPPPPPPPAATIVPTDDGRPYSNPVDVATAEALVSAMSAGLPPAPAAVGINPPPRKRGRPPGAKNLPKPTDTIPAPAVFAPAETPTSPETPASIRPAAPAAPGVLTALYIGCIPRGEVDAPPVDFDVLIAKAKQMVGEQDYRLFDFGKGNGLLLDAFTRVFAFEAPRSMFVADVRSPEAVLCLSFLRGKAAGGTVVEALR